MILLVLVVIYVKVIKNLFILCAKDLSALLKKAESASFLHGIVVACGALRISHLLFADASMLFFQLRKLSV